MAILLFIVILCLCPGLAFIIVWAGLWIAAIALTIFALTCAAGGILWPLLIVALAWTFYLARDVPN